MCFERALSDGEDRYMTCSMATTNAASLIKEFFEEQSPLGDEDNVWVLLLEAAMNRVDWETVMKPFVEAQADQFDIDMKGF